MHVSLITCGDRYDHKSKDIPSHPSVCRKITSSCFFRQTWVSNDSSHFSIPELSWTIRKKMNQSEDNVKFIIENVYKRTDHANLKVITECKDVLRRLYYTSRMFSWQRVWTFSVFLVKSITERIFKFLFIIHFRENFHTARVIQGTTCITRFRPMSLSVAEEELE